MPDRIIPVKGGRAGEKCTTILFGVSAPIQTLITFRLNTTIMVIP
jgi:hypothetical protein